MRACLEEKCRLTQIWGWVISTIAGWFVVTADIAPGMLSGHQPRRHAFPEVPW
jgi:hypothetical protein